MRGICGPPYSTFVPFIPKAIDNPQISVETPLKARRLCPDQSMSPSPLHRDPSMSQPMSQRPELLRTSEPETDLAELAARFAAQSGGGLSTELSTDLALEIVFNEIVEQACLATGATGAAIVLWRDEEMVCRATSGMTAPALGSRLDPATGISGECIRTLSTQRCDDVLADPRADVAAAKQIGIRSLMVMPILRGEKLLGIFELFSSRTAAFGERDQRTLEVLVSRTQTNIDRASQPLRMPEPPMISRETIPREISAGDWPVAAPGVSPPWQASSISEGFEAESPEAPPLPSFASALHAIQESSTDSNSFDSAEQRLAEQRLFDQRSGEQGLGEQRPVRPGSDFPTLALAVAVLICAVALGVLVGRHFGIQVSAVRWMSAPPAAAKAAAPVALPTAASSASKQPSPETAQQALAARPAADAVPPGGLLVSQNGKEVFRLQPGQNRPLAGTPVSSTPAKTVAKNQATPDQSTSPAATSPASNAVTTPAANPVTASVDANKPVEISTAEAEDNLLYRVEPEYPDDARKQGVQGEVVLDVLIGGDGKVQDVHVDSGPPQLTQSCVDAVKQWRYRPRKQNGLEMRVHTTVNLDFRLPASSGT